METNDFGHSATHTASLIDSIKTKIKTDEIKDGGGSLQDVVDVLLDEDTCAALAKDMQTVLCMKALADLAGVDVLTLNVMVGNRYRLQGLVEHPLAVEFQKLVDESDNKTIGDILEFMLSKEKTPASTDQFLNSIEGLEFEWFVTDILHRPCHDHRLIAKTKQLSLEKEAAHQASLKASEEMNIGQLMQLPHDEAVEAIKKVTEGNKE